jgi:hypothetical protein
VEGLLVTDRVLGLSAAILKKFTTQCTSKDRWQKKYFRDVMAAMLAKV